MLKTIQEIRKIINKILIPLKVLSIKNANLKDIPLVKIEYIVK